MAVLCKYAAVCPVCTGGLSDMPALARQYRMRYCAGEWQECARYAVSEESGPSAVPRTLLPNQHDRGYELVSRVWRGRGAATPTAVFGPV